MVPCSLAVTHCILGSFSWFFVVCCFFFKINFCQTVWMLIRPDDLLSSGLIWVQTVCQGYQQTTLVDKEFNKLTEHTLFCWNSDIFTTKNDSMNFILFWFSGAPTRFFSKMELKIKVPLINFIFVLSAGRMLLLPVKVKKCFAFAHWSDKRVHYAV